MTGRYPSLSTDQIAAFVELARQGNLRRAAEVLHITEQGVRNRLLALEQRLRCELYRKSRGMRRATPLTPRGQQFLPLAVAFLERAAELAQLFDAAAQPADVHVAASHYLTRYLLIDAIRRFHRRFPQIRVRLSTQNEQEIETVLLRNPDLALGVAAPYESPPELHYQHLFSLAWSLITPRGHRLAARERVALRDLVDEPLILFERGSTGRQHVLEAFHERQLSPQIHMETTNTEIVVQMVEAGLGVAIVPLLPSGAVTRGCRLAVRPLREAIRPIRSGILTRRGERLSTAAQEFVSFIRAEQLEQPRTAAQARGPSDRTRA